MHTNFVTLNGNLVEHFVFAYEVLGEQFFSAAIEIKRQSGQVDVIPLIISERCPAFRDLAPGAFINVSGEFRSRNADDHLILYVFCADVSLLAHGEYMNTVTLEGVICKKNEPRDTPLGRHIHDFILAVKRQSGRSDYLPCISWGRNADYTSTLDVGTRIQLNGRIQSREYHKGDRICICYEFSVISLKAS